MRLKRDDTQYVRRPRVTERTYVAERSLLDASR